jgi:hypothetical protein
MRIRLRDSTTNADIPSGVVTVVWTASSEVA